MPRGVYVRKSRQGRAARVLDEPEESSVVLQPRMSTTSALFVGELKNVGSMLKNDFVITLRVLDGSGKFIFSDETGEARLIILSDEGTRQLRADDFAGSLEGSTKLRLSSADPAPGSGPKSGRNRSVVARLTYQCSIHVPTREEMINEID